MRCPYLREAQIKYCRAAEFKKLILRTPGSGADERCVSPDWVTCAIAKHRNEEHPSQEHCPFLHEMLGQYCSIAPVRTFVPYSDSPASRCSNDGHKYCEAYKSLVGAGEEPAADDESSQCVDGIPMPGRLMYSQNHMWLDVDDGRVCHVGIDGLLSWAIGTVDRIKFFTTEEAGRPVAVISAGAVDLRMVFRNLVTVTGVNTFLRSHPEKLTSEPYGSGWLFEGVCNKQTPKDDATDAGLLKGKRARTWMSKEIERMNAFLHERIAETRLMPDGGKIARGAMREMGGDAAQRFYNEFFSPEAARRVNP